MNNYELLRKKVYEIIYNGTPPLEFGCEVVWQYTHVAGHSEWQRAKRGIYVSKDYVLLYGNKSTKKTNKSELRVLGKPLQIADVLRALAMSDVYSRYAVDSDGQLRWATTGTFIGAHFNLSLPLSHPDNDEACGKVLSLLTKQDGV